MEFIGLGMYYFLSIIQYAIFADVILSWGSLFFGRDIRPGFLKDFIHPIYKNIKKIIPTTFGPFEFVPIVILFVVVFLQAVVVGFFPEIIPFIGLHL